MEKIIYLVDMDGVIANTFEHFQKRWAEKCPDVPAIPYKESKYYDLKRGYPNHTKRFVDEIFESHDFFRELPIIEGAKEALEYLSQRGEILICSSPLTKSRTCCQDKCEWIREHFGEEWVRKLILIKDKTLVRGDILIDDKPEVVGRLKPTWEHVIYDHPWNRHINGNKRLTWKNYKEVLNI